MFKFTFILLFLILVPSLGLTQAEDQCEVACVMQLEQPDVIGCAAYLPTETWDLPKGLVPRVVFAVDTGDTIAEGGDFFHAYVIVTEAVTWHENYEVGVEAVYDGKLYSLSYIEQTLTELECGSTALSF